MTYRIEIDEAASSADGRLRRIAPQVFRVDDTALVIGDGPDELVRGAARACPAAAIVLVDDG